MNELPFVACLCPTYGQPAMAANAWACFDRQDYPADRRLLIILDDAGQLAPGRFGNVLIASTPARYPSLPRKYNALASMAYCDQGHEPELYVVWEHDDVYLPHHISAHVNSLRRDAARWSHPSKVWSDYTGKLTQETAAGRFHGALALTRDAYNAVGGWPATLRADFDQTLLGTLRRDCGPPADPAGLVPSYVFRWHTGTHHAQHAMRSPDDETWYSRTPAPTAAEPIELRPEMDAGTKAIFAEVGFTP